MLIANILIHNPLAEMYGPHFLILYGALIAIAVLVTQFFRDEATTDLLQLPTQPDPYEIAYLRGGIAYVLELACFSLLQRGYLKLQDESLAPLSTHPNLSELNSLEERVFKAFNRPQAIATVKANLELTTALEEQYHRQAIEKQWFPSEVKKRIAFAANAIAVGFLLSLASYKIVVALINGHRNIGFLVLMALAATFLFANPFNPYTAPRLTRRAQSYLSRLKTAFSTLTVQAESAYNSLLAIALFGSYKLIGTPYQDYSSLFKTGYSSAPSSSRSSSSYPSSCSGSCSSCGSSCGGGCGGGCGGCGG